MRIGLGLGLGRGGGRPKPASIGDQSFGVQIAAHAYAPSIGDQTFAVTIAAEEGGGYDPENYPDPLGWFDALDPTSYTLVGSAVSAWVNKFTGASYAEGSDRPVYNATHMGGKPAIIADGSNDKLLCTTDTTLELGLDDQNDCYLIAVVQADDTDAVETFFSIGNSANAGPGSKRWGTTTTGTPGKWLYAGTGDVTGGLVSESTVSVTADPTIYEAKTVSGVTYLRISRAGTGQGSWTAGSATAHVALTPNQAALFVRASGPLANFFDGALSELIAYGAGVATSTTFQDEILAGVNAKWEIF